MTAVSASHPKSAPEAPPAAEAARVETPPAEPVLMRLVHAIEELVRQHGGAPPPPVDADDSGGRDEDDNHVYVWVDLPDYRGPDVDMNLHGRTLMIRFSKIPNDA